MSKTLLETVREKIEQFKVYHGVKGPANLEIFMTQMEIDRFRIDLKEDIIERGVTIISDNREEFMESFPISRVVSPEGSLLVTHDPLAGEGSLLIQFKK